MSTCKETASATWPSSADGVTTKSQATVLTLNSKWYRRRSWQRFSLTDDEQPRKGRHRIVRHVTAGLSKAARVRQERHIRLLILLFSPLPPFPRRIVIRIGNLFRPAPAFVDR